MKRYILTGAPGAGKTTIIRALQDMGQAVVEEAATDVNMALMAVGVDEPWRATSFIDDIVELQRQRQMQAESATGQLTFFDRSPVCTDALARHLGVATTPVLARELDRIVRDRIYERRVFFIDNLGFIERTEVRRISFEDSLAFEAIHEEAYRSFGFDLVRIPVDAPRRRAELVLRLATG